MDQLIATIPLIAAIVVPPVVALLRQWIVKIIPTKWFPVLLPMAGGIVAGAAHIFGVDAGDLQADPSSVAAWEAVITGMVTGSAAVGVHQIAKQRKKPA